MTAGYGDREAGDMSETTEHEQPTDTHCVTLRCDGPYVRAVACACACRSRNQEVYMAHIQRAAALARMFWGDRFDVHSEPGHVAWMVWAAA